MMKKNQFDYRDFVKKNIDLQVNIDDDPMTTWANNLNDRMISPVVLNRYQKVLRKINIFLLSLLLILIIVAAAMIIRFLFFHPHEIYIFNDGTDITCLYDPNSGEMKQNDK